MTKITIVHRLLLYRYLNGSKFTGEIGGLPEYDNATIDRVWAKIGQEGNCLNCEFLPAKNKWGAYINLNPTIWRDTEHQAKLSTIYIYIEAKKP